MALHNINLIAQTNFWKVVDERRRTGVDARCQDMTATWRREQHAVNPEIELCEYYEVRWYWSVGSASGFDLKIHLQGFQERGLELRLNGVYSLDDLKDFGRKNQICPYFFARHSINFANVVIYSYQYMLNPRISDLVSAQFKKDCIVVFDEAHNIGTDRHWHPKNGSPY
jgi:DNA excision repair protein ERCC-2